MATLRYATLFLNDISIKQKVRASRAQLCTVVQRRKSSADRSEYRIPIYLLPIRRVTIIRFSLAILQMMEEFHLNNRNVKQSHKSITLNSTGNYYLKKQNKQQQQQNSSAKAMVKCHYYRCAVHRDSCTKRNEAQFVFSLLALSRFLRCDNDQQQQCKTN